MNSGLWISFSLSSGRADRLLTTGRATPLARFRRWWLDVAPKQLPNPTILIP